MLIKKPDNIKSSEITSKELYESRRDFMSEAVRSLGAVAAGVSASGLLFGSQVAEASTASKLTGLRKSAFSISEATTPYKDVTTYNNFYEFGTDKYSPAKLAGTLNTHPWSISIEGEVKHKKTYDIDALLKLAPLEERIYRFRCVEGWSMVVPWVGYSLSELIKKVEPNGNAKFVEFVTLQDPKQMPGQRSSVLDWPYVEGLRMDEAMNPLTLLTMGLYGEVLPNQNGAPVRLITPWKYGFKSAKSIVKIRFTATQPVNTWQKANANEYGFQARERRLGEFSKRETLMFNGYSDQVAQMYTGMDLKKFF
jgi:sulfoxide reductase catalytic subunit YedY